MQFSEITKAVHDAWTFVWPPTVTLILAWAVLSYIAPQSTDNLKSTVQKKLTENANNVESIRTNLEPYGLAKIIPLFSFIAVVFVLYLVNSVGFGFCSKIPPKIIYQPEQLILPSLSTTDKELLLRRYSSARNVEEALNFALQENRNNSKEHINRAELYFNVGNFIKFAAAAAILGLFFGVFRDNATVASLFRFILIAVALSVAWLVNLAPLLYHQEQKFYDEWSNARLEILSTPEL